MSMARGVGRLLRSILVLGPLAALLASVLIDVGPDGGPRTTAFFLGLGLSDPFLRDCVANSVAAAALSAALALGLGTLAGHQVARWSFWGRAPLAAWALAPMAVPPLFAALGLRYGLDRFGRDIEPGTLHGVLTAWGPSAVWVLAGAATGAPWVALAVADALRRFEPAGIDAGRLVGLGRLRAWWVLVWPTLRPAAAAATAGVFARALGDPGPPLVLGLRRSLAYQAVASLTTPLAAPRAALLGLAGLVLGWVGLRLIVWWGGADSLGWRPPSSSPAPSSSWRRGLVGAIALTLLGLVGWLPVAGLGLGLTEYAEIFKYNSKFEISDLMILDIGLRSLVLAAVVAPLLVVLSTGAERGLGSVGRLAATSPLALAIGVALLPGMVAALLGPSLAADLPAWDMRASGTSLVWATAAALAPIVLVLWGTGPARRDDGRRLAREEAAILIGQTRSRARRTAGAIGPSYAGLPALVLLASLAATSVAPALVLSTSPYDGPVSAAAVGLADARWPGPRQAAALGVLAVLTNLAAVLWLRQAHPRGLVAIARAGAGPV
jgi:ABC-type Fe3+ transport system permease subunit